MRAGIALSGVIIYILYVWLLQLKSHLCYSLSVLSLLSLCWLLLIFICFHIYIYFFIYMYVLVGESLCSNPLQFVQHFNLSSLWMFNNLPSKHWFMSKSVDDNAASRDKLKQKKKDVFHAIFCLRHGW